MRTGALLLVPLLALAPLVLVAAGELEGAEAWVATDFGMYSFGTVLSMSWSPDGSMIAVAGESPDVAGSVLYACNGSFAYGLDPGFKLFRTNDIEWSPDGSMIAAAAEDYDYNGTLIVFWSNGTLAWTKSLPANPSSVSWSPNSSMVAVTYGYNLTVFTRDGEEVVHLAGPEESTMNTAAWGPDGRIAIGMTTYNYTNSTGYVVLANLSGEIWDANVGPADSIKALAWDSSGNYIVAAGSLWVDAIEETRITVHTASGEETYNTTINLPIVDMSASQDGILLAFSGLTSNLTAWWRIALLDPETGSLTWGENHTGNELYSIAASPNGQSVAVSMGDLSVHLLGQAPQCSSGQQGSGGSTTTSSTANTGTTQGGESHGQSTSTQSSGATSSHEGQAPAETTTRGGSQETQQAGTSGGAISQSGSTGGQSERPGAGIMRSLEERGVTPEIIGIGVIILLLILILLKK